MPDGHCLNILLFWRRSWVSGLALVSRFHSSVPLFTLVPVPNRPTRLRARYALYSLSLSLPPPLSTSPSLPLSLSSRMETLPSHGACTTARLVRFFVLSFPQGLPSKHAGSYSHPVRIGWKALARSGPDDSCTPACFRTGSVGPNPSRISQN